MNTKILQVLNLLQQDQTSSEWSKIDPHIVQRENNLAIMFDNADCGLYFDATGEKFLGVCNWKEY